MGSWEKKEPDPPTVHTFARPATPQEVDSESDDDEDLDDQDGGCDQDDPDHEGPRKEAENRSMQDAAQKENGTRCRTCAWYRPCGRR